MNEEVTGYSPTPLLPYFPTFLLQFPLSYFPTPLLSYFPTFKTFSIFVS